MTPAADGASSRFNISRWALEHPALTRYLMVVLLVLGAAAYFQLGQDEDPPFTFRAMVVQAFWPGASAQQMAEQVTDKIEKTLQEVPYADKIRSFTKPGESLTILQLKDSSPAKEVAGSWYQARKRVGDIRSSLPQGVIGPVFNDDFGYLRSIVETLQHGRPWTDDWLEPWAASLSVLSAGIFKVTGSFRLATYGLQALLAGGIVGLAAMLLHRRQVPVGLAVAWSLAGLTFPTMLWKVAEFGALPLYVFCLLAAIKAAERGRWWCFTAAWLVALASRQSALLWLALPAGLMLANREAGWGRMLGRLALIAIGGGLVYWAIGQGMNRTNAQAVMQPGILTQIEWSRGIGHVGLAPRHARTCQAGGDACCRRAITSGRHGRDH